MNEVRRIGRGEEIARIVAVVARHAPPELVSGFDVELGEFDGEPAMWIVFKLVGSRPAHPDERRARSEALQQLKDTIHQDLMSEIDDRYPLLSVRRRKPEYTGRFLISPESLLDFASDLIANESGSEAAARRAISTAYYALFHALAREGASAFTGSRELRERLARSYDHGSLAAAAREVERRQQSRDPPVPDPRLVQLARIFRRLREAREQADYDLASTVAWADADELFNEALGAFNLLRELRQHPELEDVLLSPLIQRRPRRG